MTDYAPATRPTLYFIGVTTGKSSIMKVFPAWADYLGLEDAAIKGIDFPLHADPDAYRSAVAFIRDDPGRYGLLQLRKVWLALEADERGSFGDDFEALRPASPVLRLPLVMFGTVVPLALFGLGLCIRRRQWLLPLFVLGAVVSLLPFFVAGRYRLPLAVPMIVLAAVGLDAIDGAVQRRGLVALLLIAPVVALTPTDSVDAAIDLVNAGDYGLQAGIFTRDIDTAFAAARRLRVGGVIINDTSSYHADVMPYGGVKNSGYGLEGPKYAVQDMTDPRVIVLNLGATGGNA